MKQGWEESPYQAARRQAVRHLTVRHLTVRHLTVRPRGTRRDVLLRIFWCLLFIACAAETTLDSPVSDSQPSSLGHPGGRLVIALSAEPETFNPALVNDLPTRTVIHRIMADLIRIDRASQHTDLELAESVEVTDDGRTYTLRLRPGLRFSDGQPMDADDVVFSFRVYLDEAVASPLRDVLLIAGRPVEVRKIDPLTIVVELPAPYAAADRLFDGFAILPQHRLAAAYEAGRLTEAWGIETPPEDIVGLGPFRLAGYRPGQSLTLERNPYYWKTDPAGQQLPYLDQIQVQFTTQESQALSFLGREIDVVDGLTPGDFAALNRESPKQDYRLHDLGAGLDFHFMFFNLNDLTDKPLPQIARKQAWFRELNFRRAVLEAIDLESIVRLVFQGRAAALAAHVPPGNRHWINDALSTPSLSRTSARQRLTSLGYHWDDEGRLLDDADLPVSFTLMTVASRPQMIRAATIIEDDLRQLGITVQVAPLDLGAILQRLFTTHDYEACLLGLGGGSGGPNPAMNLLRSSGSHHFWRLGREPETLWQREIDQLMTRQAATLDAVERKQLYDRVQQIVADQLPFLALVSPNVLVGAKTNLANFQPALLPHHTLWNAEELFWQTKSQ